MKRALTACLLGWPRESRDTTTIYRVIYDVVGVTAKRKFSALQTSLKVAWRIDAHPSCGERKLTPPLPPRASFPQSQIHRTPPKTDGISDLSGPSVGRRSDEHTAWWGTHSMGQDIHYRLTHRESQTQGGLTLDALGVLFACPHPCAAWRPCPYRVNLFIFKGPGRRDFYWWNVTTVIDGNSQKLLLSDFPN